MTLLSTLLSLTAIALSFKSIRTIPMRVILALLCFFQLFLLGFYFVADHLTGSGVNESVLYREFNSEVRHPPMQPEGILGTPFLAA